MSTTTGRPTANKTHAATTLLRAVRGAGVVLGLFFIFSAVFADALASDAEPHPSPGQLLAQRFVFAIAVLPLLVPWRRVRSAIIRRVLLVILAGAAAYFSFTSVTSVIWAFQHGEPVQIVAFILIGLCTTFVLLAQFPAVFRLTNATEPNVA